MRSAALVSLGSIISEDRSGASIKREEFTDSGVSVVPKKAISNHIKLDDSTFGFTSNEFYAAHIKAVVQEGHLVTTLRNLNPDGSTLGLICENHSTNKMLLAQGLYAFKFSEDVHPRYICYVSRTPTFREAIQRIKVGSTQVHIRAREFKEIQVPLPPLKEQKRIAAILDKADAIRRKRQQAITLADEFLRSVFLDMFGDPVSNPKGWKVDRLENHLSFVTSGSRGWAKYYSEDGPLFVRSLDVQMNKLVFDDAAHIQPPANAEADRTLVRKGDVLLTITGSRIGRVAPVIDDLGRAHISQHVAILRPKATMSSQFLSMFMSDERGGQKLIKQSYYGQTKPGLNLQQIKDFTLPIPPLEKQLHYVSILENTKRSRTKNTESEQAMDELSRSISTAAFEGRISSSVAA